MMVLDWSWIGLGLVLDWSWIMRLSTGDMGDNRNLANEGIEAIQQDTSRQGVISCSISIPSSSHCTFSSTISASTIVFLSTNLLIKLIKSNRKSTRVLVLLLNS